MNILDLPEEILAIIVQYLPTDREHFALANTCHYLHERVFCHVQYLWVYNQPLIRIITKYSELRVLNIIGFIPSPLSLHHLTSVRSFCCLHSHAFDYMVEPNLDVVEIREAYHDLIPWILRQPLEDVMMNWNSIFLDDRLKIFSVPTLRHIHGDLTTDELLFVSPSVEKLSITPSGFIQFTHLTNLRELSIYTIEMTDQLIDELVKVTSLTRLDLSLKDIRLEADTPLGTLPVHSLCLRRKEFHRNLSSLRHWKQLSELRLPLMSAKQLEPLLTHPNKDHLYCQMNEHGLRTPRLITELYTILQQRESQD